MTDTAVYDGRWRVGSIRPVGQYEARTYTGKAWAATRARAPLPTQYGGIAGHQPSNRKSQRSKR